jgi:hypothetical protein
MGSRETSILLFPGEATEHSAYALKHHCWDKLAVGSIFERVSPAYSLCQELFCRAVMRAIAASQAIELWLILDLAYEGNW